MPDISRASATRMFESPSDVEGALPISVRTVLMLPQVNNEVFHIDSHDRMLH